MKKVKKPDYDFESYFDGIPPRIRNMSLEEIEEALKKEDELAKQKNQKDK